MPVHQQNFATTEPNGSENGFMMRGPGRITGERARISIFAGTLDRESGDEVLARELAQLQKKLN